MSQSVSPYSQKKHYNSLKIQLISNKKSGWHIICDFNNYHNKHIRQLNLLEG